MMNKEADVRACHGQMCRASFLRLRHTVYMIALGPIFFHHMKVIGKWSLTPRWLQSSIAYYLMIRAFILPTVLMAIFALELHYGN